MKRSEAVVITDWVKYEGGIWRREGRLMCVQFPADGPFKLPPGFQIDTAKMPQNVEGAAVRISPKTRRVKVPILGWSPPEVHAYAETVYFADGVGDSHHINYDGKITIPVSGQYIYQIKGMPVVKAQFKAGDIIDYPTVFLFRVGA